MGLWRMEMAMISDEENAQQNVNAVTAIDIDWCCSILHSRRIHIDPNDNLAMV